MGTLIATAVTPVSRPSYPAHPKPTEDEKVTVCIANAGPNPLQVDVRGITNGSELFLAIERRFFLPPGTGLRLDIRLVTLETWPLYDAEAIHAFFGLPTPAIRSTTTFPDESIGLRPGAWLYGRILPRDAGRASDALDFDRTIVEAIKTLAGHLMAPFASFFTSGRDRDGSKRE
jgi:hypothetical protein